MFVWSNSCNILGYTFKRFCRYITLVTVTGPSVDMFLISGRSTVDSRASRNSKHVYRWPSYCFYNKLKQLWKNYKNLIILQWLRTKIKASRHIYTPIKYFPCNKIELDWQIEAGKIRPSFSRRYFEIHFPVWKLYIDPAFTEICSHSPD